MSEVVGVEIGRNTECVLQITLEMQFCNFSCTARYYPQ